MDALIKLYLEDLRCDAARDAMDEIKRAQGNWSTKPLPHNHPAALECREARVRRARALQDPALDHVGAALLLEQVEEGPLPQWAARAAEILEQRGETRTAQRLLSLLAWAQDAERRATS